MPFRAPTATNLKSWVADLRHQLAELMAIMMFNPNLLWGIVLAVPTRWLGTQVRALKIKSHAEAGALAGLAVFSIAALLNAREIELNAFARREAATVPQFQIARLPQR